MNELSVNQKPTELKNQIKDLMKTTSVNVIRTQLVNKGYSDELINQKLKEVLQEKKKLLLKNSNIVLFKDFIDKIGYGFSSPLLMFALLYTITKNPILIGIVLALKNCITLIISSYVREYDKQFNLNKKKIATYGTIFGILFLLLGFAKRIDSEIIFSTGIILSTLFMVLHGDLYSKYVTQKLIKSRSHSSIRFVSYFGLIISGVAFVIAGYLLDFNNITLNLGFTIVNIPGYLLIFEIIAFSFIFSSYAFSFVHPETLKRNFFKQDPQIQKKDFIKIYLKELKQRFKRFITNFNIKLIFYGTLFSGSLQTLISIFAGIYLYIHYQDTGSPFFYLSIIFGFGIIAASIAPVIARSLIKIFGKTPMLVFGVLLISIFPLSIYMNVSLKALIIANAISVIGSSTLSIVKSFIIHSSLTETEKSTYFSTVNPIISLLSPAIIIGFSVVIFLTSYHQILLILALSNLILVLPFYFALVMRAQKLHKQTKLA